MVWEPFVKSYIQKYNSPYAVEGRSLFDVVRQYRESFEVYGSKKSVEWPLIEGRPLVMHTAKRPEPEIPEEVHSPDYAHYLPEPIQRFTTKGMYDTIDHQHLSFTQGAGHGGSHPHLVHEFVSSLINNKQPYPNAKQPANITCVGILAHESAMQGGKQLNPPDFTLCKK